MQKEKQDILAKIIRKFFDTDISSFDDSFVYNTLKNRMTETNVESEIQYMSLLETNKEECQTFINSLFISYSEFFRNPFTFEVIQNVILPEIHRKNLTNAEKNIRIWSTSCASGQEVYSLSLLFQEFNKKNKPELAYTILGTDISDSQINNANKGEYPILSVRNVSLGRLGEFFTRNVSVYKVKEKLRKNVNFAVFDMLSHQYLFPPESIFGDFDLIVCSNLLYYYKSEAKKTILRKIKQSLKRNGFLITDAYERDFILRSGFYEVVQGSNVFKIN